MRARDRLLRRLDRVPGRPHHLHRQRRQRSALSRPRPQRLRRQVLRMSNITPGGGSYTPPPDPPPPPPPATPPVGSATADIIYPSSPQKDPTIALIINIFFSGLGQ